MKIRIILLCLILNHSLFAQVSTNVSLFFAKEFSKEISLYRAKDFVINKILNVSEDVVQFEMDPLAATSSGEITSLVYKCDKRNKEGLILGFYGDYWNEAGVVYQAYAYRNFPKEEAVALLKKVTAVMEEQGNYLSKDPQNNNVYFRFEDVTILIYNVEVERRIRIFWNNFDAEWTNSAFKRTKRRFEKSLN